MMAYDLLTGATGLLGSYLLRDGLRAGRQMAVLVRPSRRHSARERIEDILARWEEVEGTTLPRPVVIEGDLTQEDLDLDAPSLRWIARHCTAVIHNAASLTFRGNGPGGEPWLTNVEGTRRILELCRCTGIRRLHHVSTAYVCGVRTGRILESEFDLGQSVGNDYERSKIEAERLVRGAEFLRSLTVYRPAIIVGDSRSGYTTTFHGLYALLKLAHTLACRVAIGSTGAGAVLAAFGLSGAERKNFVPVDWVAAVIGHILGRPELHGKTYHLTAADPLPLSRMAKVLQRAVETYSTLAAESDAQRCDGAWFERNFRAQMEIYQSYFRDDPEFDATSTAAAAPHLPCPRLDEATLMRLARFAVESNFGRQRSRPRRPELDLHEHLRPLLSAGQTGPHHGNGEACIGLRVDGPGGGQWTLLVHDGRPVAAELGLGCRCTTTLLLNSRTFQRLLTGQMPLAYALVTGRVAVLGDRRQAPQLQGVLQALLWPAARIGLAPLPR